MVTFLIIILVTIVGVPVEPTNPKPGDRGETDGVGGFEAKENEWGEIAFTPWED